MKKILMKAHSPFTIFACAVIGELYYKEDYKILIMGNPVDEGFETRVEESVFFQEVCLFDQREKTIKAIEHTVDRFLVSHSDIDEYFMCVFSDGYSIVLAHRLRENTKINIFPEGCSALQLKERIELVFNEVYGKDSGLREVFQKYKIDFKLFSCTWVFDSGIEQGEFRAEKKIIEVRKLLKGRGEDNIIERLNTLYGYKPKGDYDIFVLDDTLAASDLLDGEAEIKIFDFLFGLLKEEKILVKGHPGQDLLVSKLRYEKYGVEFFQNSDIPWEIMLINLMKNRMSGITIISPLLATSVMSTISLFSCMVPITIISLHLLEKRFFGDYIKKAIRLNGAYYEKAVLGNENIRLLLPQNFEELEAYCKEMKRGIRETKKPCELGEPSDYFFRTGNMLAKTVAFSPDGQFFVDAAFYFLHYDSEIIFSVEKYIDITVFVWRPSKCNLFSAVSGLIVEIENGQGNRREYVLGDSQTNRFLDDGKITCEVEYCGYCKKLYVKGHLMVEHKYCNLNWLYHDCKWRGYFWEQWFEIEKKKLLKKYLESKGIKDVWIFGNGKIGQEIRGSLELCNVKTTFIISKTPALNDNKVISIEEVCRREKLPDIMVITPMNDYDLIYFKLQEKLKEVTLGLEEFVAEVIEA